MKLTESMLRKMIKEEIRKISSLKEAFTPSEYKLTFDQLRNKLTNSTEALAAIIVQELGPEKANQLRKTVLRDFDGALSERPGPATDAMNEIIGILMRATNNKFDIAAYDAPIMDLFDSNFGLRNSIEYPEKVGRIAKHARSQIQQILAGIPQEPGYSQDAEDLKKMKSLY